MATVIRRFLREQQLLPMVCLFGLLLMVLILLSNASENSARFGEMYSWLLLVSAIGLALLTIVIGVNFYRLWLRYRSREPGSRLTMRLVAVFVSISAAPVAVVYYFSMQFLERGIDSWFDVRIELALEDALELGRASLDLRLRALLKQTERMAAELADSERSMAVLLDEMLDDSTAAELTLFAPSGRIIATAGSEAGAILPNYPPEVVLLQVSQGLPYSSLDPIRGVGLSFRIVMQLPGQGLMAEPSVLQALFHVPERLSKLADSVRTAFDDYKELVFLRGPLKTSFIWALSLVLLFGILSALWAGLHAARQLVAPIRDLAEGTRAVAAGHYDKQLPLSTNDELGFLVHSFNQMTRRLSKARDEADHSRTIVEQQRTFLQAVLSRLSTGVITLDHGGVLYTHNAAADQILGVDLDTDGSVEQPSHLKTFFDAIRPHLDEGGDWRQEITLFSSHGRQVLMCRGSSLPDSVGLQGGNVLVFDDITTLVSAQRDAAWTEVARRLAHEIKNPLTPIQLAAERLRRKYLPTMDEDAAKVMDRSTHTIVQQVQAMKDMVNAFNDYARPPAPQLQTLPLNEFITEVFYMYKDHPVAVELDLDPRDPVIKADRLRLRQLLHNLAQNAIEAIGTEQQGHLGISTRERREPGNHFVELRFDDNGPGFPTSEIGDVFEPYVTTKPKGTGLGLAIVKKIVEEHGGLIDLGPRPGGGARVSLLFPATTAGSGEMADRPAAIAANQEVG